MPCLLAVLLAAITLILGQLTDAEAATKGTLGSKTPAPAASTQTAPEFASADAMLAWIDR